MPITVSCPPCRLLPQAKQGELSAINNQDERARRTNARDKAGSNPRKETLVRSWILAVGFWIIVVTYSLCILRS